MRRANEKTNRHDELTSELIGKKADCRNGRQTQEERTDNETDRQTDSQADSQTDKHTELPVGKRTGERTAL